MGNGLFDKGGRYIDPSECVYRNNSVVVSDVGISSCILSKIVILCCGETWTVKYQIFVSFLRVVKEK